MDAAALAALYIACEALKSAPGVAVASADSDHDSGEILFTTDNGGEYRLKLEQIQRGL